MSEGGLEPVERPLDKRVSDILSAKMDPGGPGCTPLFGIGALLERTKAASDTDPGTKSEPGMSDPRSATRCGVKQLPSVVSTGWRILDNPDARS